MLNSIKRSLALIGLGIINILHSFMHVIQFVQSLVLVNDSQNKHYHNESMIDIVLHSNFFTLLWVIIGFITLWMGIRDLINYKKSCKC